jgi:hypothetical protein
MSQKWLKISLLAFLLLSAGVACFSSARLPKIFSFKEKDALDEWQEKIFRGRVFYSIKVKKHDTFLTAYSENSASGIFYEIKFDPRQFPMMSWYWKVINFPSRGPVPDSARDAGAWIEKDDYAARVYVIFPRLSFNLTKCLEYVWDKNLPVGTIITSPYSENIKLIVAESGTNNINNWVFKERNIYDDYRSAFGKNPGNVGAIAIMTDTDDTQSQAEAHYKELKVGYKK